MGASGTKRGVIARIPEDRDTRQKRGFFFIKPDDGGDDLFAHAKGMQRTSKLFEDLRVGERVEYIEIDGDRGPRAIEIRVI